MGLFHLIADLDRQPSLREGLDDSSKVEGLIHVYGLTDDERALLGVDKAPEDVEAWLLEAIREAIERLRGAISVEIAWVTGDESSDAQ